MWFDRRILKIKWTGRVTNKKVLRKMTTKIYTQDHEKATKIPRTHNKERRLGILATLKARVRYESSVWIDDRTTERLRKGIKQLYMILGKLWLTMFWRDEVRRRRIYPPPNSVLSSNERIWVQEKQWFSWEYSFVCFIMDTNEERVLGEVDTQTTYYRQAWNKE